MKRFQQHRRPFFFAVGLASTIGVVPLLVGSISSGTWGALFDVRLPYFALLFGLAGAAIGYLGDRSRHSVQPAESSMMGSVVWGVLGALVVQLAVAVVYSLFFSPFLSF